MIDDKLTMRQRLAKAKAEMTNPVKDKTADVKKYTYSYADLAQYHEIIKPALWKWGLDFEQGVKRYAHDDYTLRLVVLDAVGDEGELLLDERPWVHRMDSQALGSAETYDLRYQLRTAFGLPAEDDDGKAAHDNANAPRPDPFDVKLEECAFMLNVTHDDVKTALKAAGCKTKGDGIAFMDAAIKTGTLDIQIEV